MLLEIIMKALRSKLSGNGEAPKIMMMMMINYPKQLNKLIINLYIIFILFRMYILYDPCGFRYYYIQNKKIISQNKILISQKINVNINAI